MKTLHSILLSLVLGFTFVISATAGAQTPAASSAPTGTLATMPVDHLPGPYTEVWFLRFTLAPGGLLPESEQAGPILYVIETGALIVSSDVSVTATSTDNATQSLPPGDTTLSVADGPVALLAPDRAHVSMRNDGPEPASALVLMLASGMREEEITQTEEAAGQPSEVERGVTTVGLAIGRAEFGTGPGSITIDRLTLRAGDTSTASDSTVEAGSIESGDVDYAVTAGSGYIWPKIAAGSNQQIEPVELAAGASGTLMNADGYFFGLGTMATITAKSDTVILRALVTEQVGATPES